MTLKFVHFVEGLGGTWIRTGCTSDQFSGSPATYLPASAPCPTRQPEEDRQSLGLSTFCPSVCWYASRNWTSGVAFRRYCTDKTCVIEPGSCTPADSGQTHDNDRVFAVRDKTDAVNCLRAVSLACYGRACGARFHSWSKPPLLNVNLILVFIKSATFHEEYW